MPHVTIDAARAKTAPSQREELLKIAAFFMPLASVSMCYAIIFNVMNSTMARMENAAVILATFSIGQSIADFMAVPASQGRQWLLSRGRDKASYWAGMRVMVQVATVSMILLTLSAFTPLGLLVFGGFFRVPASLSHGVTDFLKYCIPLPVAFVVRSSSHAVLMIARKTHLITFSVLVRLFCVATAASIILRNPSLQHPAAGPLLWIGSMLIEAFTNLAFASRYIKRYPPSPESGVVPEPRRIWAFMIPLMATGLIWSLGKPTVNIGMARTTNPEHSLAVYQVAWNAGWLVLAYVQDSFRQAVVVFWSDNKSLQALVRFAKMLAAGVMALMLGATITGASSWFLRHVVGASEDLVSPTRSVFFVLSFFPVPLIVTEMCTGRLLRNGKTTPIALARGANLAVMSAAVFVIVGVAPQIGALAGALAVFCGLMAECVTVLYAVRAMGTIPDSHD